MKELIALLLAAVMLGTSTGTADEASPEPETPEAVQESEKSFLDADRLDEDVREILKKAGAKEENVSVALKFPETGETYYFNADRWLYTASLCKLPVAMTYAHKLKTGELEKKKGKSGDTYALEKILVNSSYSYYSNIAKKIYGKVNTQEEKAQALAYSGLDEDLVPEDYLTSQRYSARFFLGIVEELYENSEEYPEVIDKMKKASPVTYFRLKIRKKYPVAQKYGSDRDVVHAAGIIYTDCPILLVVMTTGKDDSVGNRVIGNIADYFAAEATEWSAACIPPVEEDTEAAS